MLRIQLVQARQQQQHAKLSCSSCFCKESLTLHYYLVLEIYVVAEETMVI